jgi:hypothetical protein
MTSNGPKKAVKNNKGLDNTLGERNNDYKAEEVDISTNKNVY